MGDRLLRAHEGACVAWYHFWPNHALFGSNRGRSLLSGREERFLAVIGNNTVSGC
jgi:hypothetical protein